MPDSAASEGAVTLDAPMAAVLDQVLVGLLPADALPNAAVFLDEEGTPVARRSGSEVIPAGALRWRLPADVRPAGPVVVPVAEQVPAGALPVGALVLLPAGGVRPDDARWPAWAAAWSHGAAEVVPVPVPPVEAATRADELVAAYAGGAPAEVATTPQPAGTGRTVFFTGLSGSGKSTVAKAVVEHL